MKQKLDWFWCWFPAHKDICFFQDTPQITLQLPLLLILKVLSTHFILNAWYSVQFSCSLCLTLCDPMDCSMPGFPVHHQLPDFTHSCPLRQRCHPTISSSVLPFSSCLQSFPASGSFLMSQFFASGGQSSGVSASASVLPMNIQADFL